ncbi:MAG TPA: RidA family protein [Candidatus Binataceae bacterium]|nr:RidA family protein [Candidatus Binataceae bacterium]
MTPIERVASNTPWEPIFGYVRKVKAGNWLAISGTTATDERGMIVGAGQMYVQARQAMSNLKHHIESAGFSLADVIRTRVFVTDISRFAEVARAHNEVFGDHPPASTLVEVKRLVHPDMMIEVEVDALRSANAGGDGGGMPIPFAKEKSQAKPRKPALKASSRTRPKPKASKPKGKR